MVSVPISGMQLAEAADIFSSILSVIGMGKRNNVIVAKEKRRKGNFDLDVMEISLITAEENEEKVLKEKSTPSFSLEKLKVFALSKEKPLISNRFVANEAEVATNDINFSVSMNQIHLHFNFPLIRLILQISETLAVVKEAKVFAQKVNNDTFSKEKHFDWEKVTAELSDSNLHIPKSWRNMYNVMNLYTTVPDETVSPKVGSPPCKLKRLVLFIVCLFCFVLFDLVIITDY